MKIKQKFKKLKNISRSVDVKYEKKMNMTNYFKDYKKNYEFGGISKTIDNPLF